MLLGHGKVQPVESLRQQLIDLRENEIKAAFPDSPRVNRTVPVPGVAQTIVVCRLRTARTRQATKNDGLPHS